MQITVNGESRRLDRPTTIAELLAALQLGERRVAVERNGEIVPRSRHASTPLADGDELLVVHAIGGG
ncbi:MAG: sulfur carrier protein ThiS [Sinimarinibacterium sp.]|jgi:sulfur carrier protein